MGKLLPAATRLPWVLGVFGGAVADRASIIWSGLLAVALCATGLHQIGAADPPIGPAVPSGVVPTLPANAESAFPLYDPAKSERKPVSTSTVTSFQRSPNVNAVQPPGEDPFREPPISPSLQKPEASTAPLLPEGQRVNLPLATKQKIDFAPRYSKLPNWKLLPSDDKNVQRGLYTGGVIVKVITVGDDGKPQEYEFATDNVVAWIKDPKGKKVTGELNTPIESNEKTEVEMYLTGNVVIRTISIDPSGARNVEQTMRANAIYYDVSKSRAIAMCGDLELKITGLPDAIHMRGKELWQLGPNEFKVFESEVSASKRPSDPGLKYTATESTFTRERRARRNIFGVPYRNLLTGEPDIGYEQILTSVNVKPRIYDTPIFYLPKTKTDIAEPFGPLAGLGFGNDTILGFQTYATWDLFKLLALRGPPGHRWQLYTDYLNLRGVGLGTEYDYQGVDLFGLAERSTDLANRANSPYYQPYSGLFRIYGLRDKRKNDVTDPTRLTDVLGGDRGAEPIPPDYRGRVQWRHNQELYENGTTYLRVLAQVEYISDKNYLEMFFKQEYDLQPNQETFVHLSGAAGNLGGSVLLEQNLSRPWVTETNWLPRADGHLIGQSFFDVFTYSTRASAGYAEFRPTTVNPLPVVVTERKMDTGRFDWNQRLELPIDLGPVRITPYGVMDLTYYTQDLNNYNGGFTRHQAGSGGNMPFDAPGPVQDPTGQGRGRFYGGGGTEASMTFSRLYQDAASELFNVNGLNHKVNVRANYFAAYSDTPYYQLPQLDRLNDDVTDQTYRTSRPRQAGLITGPAGQALSISPLYDPQQYAIRRLVDNRVDTLDTIEVLQLGVNQRLQTKRGFPGAQHIVDWMALDLSMSVFPDQNRDNYGQSVAFLDYNFLWHLGDRTTFLSAGSYDPITNGTKYFNVGMNFSRPDGTNFFLSYRHTDPVQSRAVTGVITYNLSTKYSVNIISTYDFGLNQALSNQVSISRTGADLTFLFGFSFNALQNNLGFQFAVVPNLAGLSTGRLAGSPIFGQQR